MCVNFNMRVFFLSKKKEKQDHDVRLRVFKKSRFFLFTPISFSSRQDHTGSSALPIPELLASYKIYWGQNQLLPLLPTFCDRESPVEMCSSSDPSCTSHEYFFHDVRIRINIIVATPGFILRFHELQQVPRIRDGTIQGFLRWRENVHMHR